MHQTLFYQEVGSSGTREMARRFNGTSERSLEAKIGTWIAARAAQIAGVRFGPIVRQKRRARPPYNQTKAYAKREALLRATEEGTWCPNCRDFREVTGKLETCVVDGTVAATGIVGICSHCGTELE